MTVGSERRGVDVHLDNAGRVQSGSHREFNVEGGAIADGSGGDGSYSWPETSVSWVQVVRAEAFQPKLCRVGRSGEDVTEVGIGAAYQNSCVGQYTCCGVVHSGNVAGCKDDETGAESGVGLVE